MKKSFYISLMMVLFTLISHIIYLCSLYIIVYYKIIDRYQVIPFTDITLSRPAFLLVTLIGCLIGYFIGQHWWKVIYIDGVYYFDKNKKVSK